MPILLPTQSTVLNAFAVLIGETPGNAALKEHQAFITTNGVNGYKAALESYFAATSTPTLATALLSNLGLTSFTQAQAEAYLTANPGNRVGAMIDLASQLYSYAGTDAALLASKAAYVTSIESSFNYSNVTTNNAGMKLVGVTAQTVNLTTSADNLVGSGFNDVFIGRTIDNKNTFQDYDRIDGGAGNDTVVVDLVAQTNAITPQLLNIENVVVRAQSTTNDPINGNNMNNVATFIDAQRSLAVDAFNVVTADRGVTKWEDNNSRSDLIIEDVRIGNAQKTSDVTIAMVETDPGNVDFGLYFNQYSLRNASSSTNTISLELLDTRSAANGTGPLKDNPYDRFQIRLNGTDVIFQNKGIDDALTYADLLTAVNAAIATKKAESPALATLLSGLTAALGPVFNRFDTISGKSVQGTTIVLTDSNGGKFEVSPSGGWATPTGVVPASSGLHTNIIPGNVSSVSELVTSKVILDDVGMGSTGGDLVIGGMSVGETSDSRGVERFEIEVRDNSRLQTINGTNNALREVTIVSGVTTSQNLTTVAYRTTVTNEGDLTVNGNANIGSTGTGTAVGTGSDTILKGVNNANNTLNGYKADHHGAYGFTDVRLIDASAFKGKLAFTAQITSDTIAKYIDLVDTQANPAGDVAGAGNVNFNKKGANFIYTGGNDDDTMSIVIDPAVASSRSHLVAGRADFTFNLNGGDGNDKLTVRLVNPANNGNTQNWYNNQDLNNNITIDGGNGNDTIRTPGAGDKIIIGGAGDDVIYTDNTGSQTVQLNVVNASTTTVTAPTGANGMWVFNTVDQVTALGVAPAAGFYGSTGRNINDLRSDLNNSYNFFNSKVVVNFKNIPGNTITVAGTGYKTSDLEINQAIKDSINNSAVLNKLIVAEDGPANTLVIRSLIDGVMAPADVSIGLTTLTATEVAALSVTDLNGAGAAYGIASPTATLVSTAIVAANTLYTTKGDYVTAMANDGAVNITGANSTATSDNIITPGADNDVIVLGTTVSAVTAVAAADAAASSNETVVYSGVFGNDVIVNFAGTGPGMDFLDFTALNGTTVTAAFTTDKSINVNTAASLVIPTGSTDVAAIAALYNANNAAAQNHVYVSVNTSNVGTVYTVSDPVGASNAVATLAGTIDLGDPAMGNWFTLTTANFVNSAGNNYFLVNGPTGLNGTAVAAPGGPVVAAVTVNAAGAVVETAATNTTYTVATPASSFVYSIAGFGAGDKIVSPAGVVASLTNGSFTDGTAVVQYAVGGNVVQITLTGLTNAQDGALFAATDLNTVFGAGTFA